MPRRNRSSFASGYAPGPGFARFSGLRTTFTEGQRPDQGHSPNQENRFTARHSRRLTSGGKAVTNVARFGCGLSRAV